MGETATVKAAVALAVQLSPSAPTLTQLPQLAPWIPVLSRPSDISLSHFLGAIEEHLFHPERDSSSILRADILSDSATTNEQSGNPADGDLDLEGYEFKRRVRRRFLPKRIGLDSDLEQECLLYEAKEGDEVVLLLLPDVTGWTQESTLPFYHPQVATLAIRCKEPNHGGDSGYIRIDLVPLPLSQDLPSPLPQSHRLFRTALALVDRFYKVAKGKENGYQKRVHHDLLADGNQVQDLYRVLKERYRLA